MNKGIMLVLGLIFAAPQAFASGYGGYGRATAVYHFDAHAFGKPVQSVMVHTGIGIEVRGYYPESSGWKDVQDIVMTRTRDGFFAKAILDSFYGGNSGGAATIVGVWAQYWITFTDGSRIMTEPFLHRNDGLLSPVYRDSSGRLINGYRDALVQLVKIQSAPRTTVLMWNHTGEEVQKTDAELASQIEKIRTHR